jgi:hypothetical protein
LSLFTEVLDKAVKQLPKKKPADELDPPKEIYLLVGNNILGEDTPSERWDIISDIQFIDSGTRSRPAKDGRPKRDLKIPELMSDGLFINLTKLLNQLGLPLDEFEARAEFLKMWPDAARIKQG